MNLSTFDAFKHIRPEGSFYLDDDQLHRLQKVLLSMLHDLTALAEENGIRLSLGGGSALGATRHQGFIPWDDDIDLNIDRRDYDRFLQLLREQRADRYWIHTPQDTHGYGILSTRIRLKGTSVRMREDAYGDECGVTVDLFPIENTYDNAALRRVHGFFCMLSGFLVSCRKAFRDRAELRAIGRDDPALKKTFGLKIALGFLSAWGSVDFWTRAADRCYRFCRDDGTAFVAIPAGRKHFTGELYRRAAFCALHKVRFEDGMFYCTKDIDNYMTRLFGDYHTLPAPEDRERHVFYSFDLGDAI